MSTTQVGVRIPDRLYQKLEEYSSLANLSKSQTIISALADYLDSTDDMPLAVKLNRLEAKFIELENKFETFLSEHK